MALISDGRQVYVALYEADHILVTDTESGQVSAELSGQFHGPNGIARSPDGSLALIANQAGQHTSIVDLATGAEVAALLFPGAPRRVAVRDVPAFERCACETPC